MSNGPGVGMQYIEAVLVEAKIKGKQSSVALPVCKERPDNRVERTRPDDLCGKEASR